MVKKKPSRKLPNRQIEAVVLGEMTAAELCRTAGRPVFFRYLPGGFLFVVEPRSIYPGYLVRIPHAEEERLLFLKKEIQQAMSEAIDDDSLR